VARLGRQKERKRDAADRAREGRVDALGDGGERRRRDEAAASTVTKIELRPGSAGWERSRRAMYGAPCAGLAAAARLWLPRCRSDFRGDEGGEERKRIRGRRKEGA